jgi:hypothetical protein
MQELHSRIHTEIDIKAYEGYLPDEWCERTITSIPRGTALERLLLDLLKSWRSTAYTAQMPATAVRVLHAAAVGRGDFVSPDRSIIAYSDNIITRLVQLLPELMEERPLRAKLMATCQSSVCLQGSCSKGCVLPIGRCSGSLAA